MRSVPHRVIGLLGLDDGVFPRPSPRDGDNLLLGAPRVGERNPQAEDRQLLLDAVMAAQDHLVITYEGRGCGRTSRVPLGARGRAARRRRPDRSLERRELPWRRVWWTPLKSVDRRKFEPASWACPVPSASTH